MGEISMNDILYFALASMIRYPLSCYVRAVMETFNVKLDRLLYNTTLIEIVL